MLHIDPPRVIGESEEEYRARSGKIAARARSANPNTLLVESDCWRSL